MLVGVAIVAAAMYVAVASGSQQSRGPTARQFNALKKEVTSLSKTLKTVKTEADDAVTIIGGCYLTASGSSATFTVLPVAQFGGTGDGFLFGTNTTFAPRSALDVYMGGGSAPDGQPLRPPGGQSDVPHQRRVEAR